MEPLSPRRTFKQYKAQVSGLHSELAQVEADLELQRANARVHFAIDFAALYNYAYPLAHVTDEFLRPLDDKATDDEKAEALTRQRMALTIGLRHLPQPLILLPPHAAEFKFHLKSRKRQAAAVMAEVGLLEVIGRRLLERAGQEDTAIKAAIEQLMLDDGQLTSKQKSQVAGFLELNFRDIWALLTTNRRGSPTRILNLLDTGHLQLVGDAFPDFSAQRLGNPERMSAWRSRIRRQPGRTGRYYANEADARACEYLVELNQHLNPRGQLVVFVSHSYAMQRTLSSGDFINVGAAANVSPIRSLSYLLARLLCIDPSAKQEIDPTRLRRYRGTIGRFRAQLVDDPGTKEDELTAVMRLVGDFLRIYGNIQRFLEADDSLASEFDADTEESRRLLDSYGIDKDVVRILRNDTELRSHLEARANDHWIEAERHTQTLMKVLNRDPHTVQYLRDLATERLESPVRIATDQKLYLPGLTQVLSEDARDALRAMRDRSGSTEPSTIVSASDFLYRGSKSSPPDPSACAALSILWTEVGEWENGTETVELGISGSAEGSALRHELTLLRSVLSRNHEKVELDEQLLTSLVELGEDPRALRELGIWKWIESRLLKASSDAQGSGENSARALDVAIDYVEAALAKTDGEPDDLSIHLINKLAFFLAERDQGSDLARAQELMSELINVSENVSASFAFRDTVGFIQGCLALKLQQEQLYYASDAEETWQNLKEQAVHELQAVLRNGQLLPPWHRELVEVHLDDVRHIGTDVGERPEERYFGV